MARTLAVVSCYDTTMTLGLLVLLVVGAGALLVAWRGRLGRQTGPPPVSLPLPRGPHHMHYCTRCDRQWEHSGASHECTRSWAAPCPACNVHVSPA